MPYGPPLYVIFLGHIFCKYGWLGVVRIVFNLCNFIASDEMPIVTFQGPKKT